MLKFLEHITRGYRRHLAAIVVVDVADVLFSLLFVWFSKVIIDIATGAESGSLLHYSLALIAFMLVQIVLRIIDVRLRNMTEVRLGNNIRHTIFSHLIYARWEHLPSLHSGDMLTRIIRDTDDVVKTLVTALPLVVSASLQLVGALVLLFVLDPMLAVILGTAMPLLAFFSKFYYVRMRKYTHQVKESESRVTTLVEESLLNQLVIRTFERQEGNLSRLESLQDELRYRVRKRTGISVFANAMMYAAFSGGYVTAFLWSAFGLAKKTVTFGTVTAYLQLVARIQRPLFDLMRLLPTVIAAKTAADRLVQLTEFEQEGRQERQFLSGAVSLHIDNVSFAYPPDSTPVLKGFSLVAEPGNMIAVMGETGAGKTTLIRLLLALIKPDEGSIVLRNDTERIEVSEATRSNFVYVPQGKSLFSGTIRENLLVGDETADDMRLRRVLETASASFVFELPEGLETLIGENGSGLSEGQAQRIAIARSLLRPGKILLLDEATSALDAETEKRFLQRLKEETGNRIVLFITHHAEVAHRCDKVVRI